MASGIGIAGGYYYNIYMTGIAAAAYCFDVLLSLIQFNLGGVLYGAFFAYPHFFLIKEIRAGTMSKENYANEEMSCCCV